MHGRAEKVLEFVRQHGPTRAKDVQAHFDHGRIRRWGGDLNVSTHLLDGLHYRGLLRVKLRESGTRVYEAVELALEEDNPEIRAVRAERLLDVVVRLYAPLPAGSLRYLCVLLRYGVAQLAVEIRQLCEQAKSRYAHAEVDRQLWFWPRGENPASVRHRVDEQLRFLTPFDPVVWDRRRFRLFWRWEYKLEAYVPAHKRQMGHYAMPMLWGEEMLGWANLKVVDRKLLYKLGFNGPRPSGRAFRVALDDALQKMQKVLGL